jgi:hypothetical protein
MFPAIPAGRIFGVADWIYLFMEIWNIEYVLVKYLEYESLLSGCKENK